MSGAKDRDGGDSNAMLYEGASISQLKELFQMDARDVSAKMRNVNPCGSRRGFPIWKVKDAAQALMPPRITEADVLEYLSTLSFKNLPAALNKEVWNGLRARLKFEQEQGKLWEGETVQSIVNELMQTIRIGILLVPDRLEMIDSVTAKQRADVQALMDSVLEDARTQVQKRMGDLATATPGIMDYSDDDADNLADEVPPSLVEDHGL